MDSDIGALTIIFTEFFYWITVVIMFLIHTGFCIYEVGASRTKNMTHTLMKNAMLIPLVTITFFFFGWWIYLAFANGPFIYQGRSDSRAVCRALERADGAAPRRCPPPAPGFTAEHTAPWARINGVFWEAFFLFSCTAASILLRRRHRAHPIERILAFRRARGLDHLGHRRRVGLVPRMAGWSSCWAITTPMRRA